MQNVTECLQQSNMVMHCLSKRICQFNADMYNSITVMCHVSCLIKKLLDHPPCRRCEGYYLGNF
jgi:hypothetical protein